MLSSWDVWAGIVWPAAVTAALMLLAWRATRRRWSARDSRSWAGPAVVGVGFIAGYAALFGIPNCPPHDAVDWLFWMSWLLVLWGLLVTLWPIDMVGRAVSLVVTLPAALLLLAWPVLSSDGEHGWLLVVAACVYAVPVLLAYGALAARMSGLRLAALLAVASALGSITLVLSGSLRLGQIGAVLTATQVGALAALMVLGHAARGRGVVLVFGPLWAGLLLCGVLYSSLEIPAAALLLAAPIAALVANRGPLRPSRQVRRALVQLALVALVAGLPVVLAWLH